MIKKIEKIAKSLIILALVGLFILEVIPIEPAKAVVNITATVSSTMTSCTTPMDSVTNMFGTIDNTAIYSATTSSTTISSSGTIYFKAQDTNGTNSPGLYKATTALIESPNAAFAATATLAANTEGFGIAATTTGTMVIDPRYNWSTSGTNYVVGGLASTTAATVASSTAAVSSQVIRVDYRTAVNVSTPGGAYTGQVTYSCTTS